MTHVWVGVIVGVLGEFVVKNGGLFFKFFIVNAIVSGLKGAVVLCKALGGPGDMPEGYHVGSTGPMKGAPTIMFEQLLPDYDRAQEATSAFREAADLHKKPLSIDTEAIIYGTNVAVLDLAALLEDDEITGSEASVDNQYGKLQDTRDASKVADAANGG